MRPLPCPLPLLPPTDSLLPLSSLFACRRDASKVKSRLASAIDRKRLEKAQRRGLTTESEAYKSLKLTKAEMAEAEAEAVNKVETTTYEAMMADDSEDSD